MTGSDREWPGVTGSIRYDGVSHRVSRSTRCSCWKQSRTVWWDAINKFADACVWVTDCLLTIAVCYLLSLRTFWSLFSSSLGRSPHFTHSLSLTRTLSRAQSFLSPFLFFSPTLFLSLSPSPFCPLYCFISLLSVYAAVSVSLPHSFFFFFPSFFLSFFLSCFLSFLLSLSVALFVYLFVYFSWNCPSACCGVSRISQGCQTNLQGINTPKRTGDSCEAQNTVVVLNTKGLWVSLYSHIYSQFYSILFSVFL